MAPRSSPAGPMARSGSGIASAALRWPARRWASLLGRRRWQKWPAMRKARRTGSASPWMCTPSPPWLLPSAPSRRCPSRCSGDWGTGKSTFMRLMSDRIQQLAALSCNNPGLSLFAANVRQVRFNAWHYSDDQVWVGLVDHLFQALVGTDVSDLREPEEVRREQSRLEAALAEKQARRQRLARARQDKDSGKP